MLGKLMKYEWKATWKLLVPLNLFIVLMTILAYCTVQMSFFDSNSNLVIMTGIIVMMTYLLSMFVVAVGSVIYLIYRFYTSVYGDEGYLLHTLPVDKHHIIVAKALTSMAWVLMNAVLVYFSFFFLLSTQAQFMEAMTEGFEFYVDVVNGYNDKIGVFGIVMTFVASFFALGARILKISACISLGQLASNHKILSAFGFYYAIYFVQKMFSILYYLILELGMRAANYSYSGYIFTTSWEFTLISSLVYCVIFYILTWYVMDRKLNLD